MLTISIVCHIPSHVHHAQESLLPAGVMGGRVAVVVDDKVPARPVQQLVRGVPVQQRRVAPVPGRCATIQKSCKVFWGEELTTWRVKTIEDEDDDQEHVDLSHLILYMILYMC